MLEQRRLQRLGQSTLTVSLPKAWVEQLNLKKGDVVGITADEQGRLVIHPSLQMLPVRSRCVIKADGVDDELLRRLVLGAYIVGHETIEIRSDGALTASQMELARRTVNDLIGVGMVEQGEKRILIQSFLDPSKFPIDGLMMRLHLIVESMLDLAVRALVERRSELAKQVVDMDAEADKVYFLATRQLLQAVEDKALAERVGVADTRNIIGDRMVVKVLEEVGDYAQVIAGSAARINQLGYYDRATGEAIAGLREQARKTASLAMLSLSKGDPESANSAIAEYGRLAEMERRTEAELNERLTPSSAAVAMELKSVTQSIRQIGRYYMISAETMINRAVERSTGAVSVVKGSESEFIQYMQTS